MENIIYESIFGLESAQLKFGKQSLNELSWEIKKYNPKRILLIIDPALNEFGLTQKVLNQITSAKTEFIIYDNISIEPTLESLQDSSNFGKENEFDLISIRLTLKWDYKCY